MQTINSVSEMRTAVAQLQQDGRTIALVPTAGALHAGHAAVVALAKERASVVVVAIFPNPLAFGPSEKFTEYPRTPDDDVRFCEDAKVDIVFQPSAEEMLPRGFSTFVTEEVVAKPLCGVSRPTHFRGVTTITAKLLNIVRPQFVALGQRDPQQVAVLRKMIADLAFETEVLVAPVVREADGLPVTVRTRGLSPNQRQEAQAIHAALQRAHQMVAQGVRSPDRIIAEATHILGQKRQIRVIYVSIVNPQTMEAMREVVPGSTLLAIAVWVGEVRLIDNALL
jgi:pantoate--beta-alanine ligase